MFGFPWYPNVLFFWSFYLRSFHFSWCGCCWNKNKRCILHLSSWKMLPNSSFTHSSCWIQPQCNRYETLYSTSGLKNPPISIFFFPSSQEKQTLAKKKMFSSRDWILIQKTPMCHKKFTAPNPQIVFIPYFYARSAIISLKGLTDFPLNGLKISRCDNFLHPGVTCSACLNSISKQIISKCSNTVLTLQICYQQVFYSGIF